ncbi:MAG: hypothetical protein AB7V58_05980 [Solirubrobacterales bacterium]
MMTDQPSSTATTEHLPSVRGRANGKPTGAGGERFDWNLLVARLVHPAVVMIVEALWSIEEAASPTDLTRMFDHPDGDGYSLSLIAYHARRLSMAGVLTVARTELTGRNQETFYALAERS